MRRITIYALGFLSLIVTAIPASAQMYYGPGYGADPYYANGGYVPGSDAFASGDYGAGDDAYLLHGAYISGPEAIQYCAQTFRSYDPQSQTYLAYSGRRVPCPQ